MQVLTNVVNFFLGLGAPIFVPIIMIVGSILAPENKKIAAIPKRVK